MPQLLLFDIDLTILRTGGAGLRAMEEAFAAHTGRRGPLTAPHPDGQTDPVIVERLFALNDAPYEAARDYEPFMRRYLARLEEEAQHPADWQLMPGVVPFIERLAHDNRYLLGLLTGNDERGARHKLSAFDLNRFFAIGGFGSDSALRHELIPVAIARAERHFGVPLAPCDVLTIGDSIYDVRAALQAGIGVLAVASGRTGAAELAAEGARHILPDLADTEAALAMLEAVFAEGISKKS